MSDFKILVEECGTDFRKYHTNWELVLGPSKELKRNGAPLNPRDENHPYELSRNVLRLDGVTKVILSSYCLSVYIGKAFDWEPIEESVLETLIYSIFATNVKLLAIDLAVPEGHLERIADYDSFKQIFINWQKSPTELLEQFCGSHVQIDRLEISPHTPSPDN